jgi:hypothetical protein
MGGLTRARTANTSKGLQPVGDLEIPLQSAAVNLWSNSGTWARDPIVEVGFRRLVAALLKTTGANHVDIYIADDNEAGHSLNYSGSRPIVRKKARTHSLAPQYWTWSSNGSGVDFDSIPSETLAPIGDVRHKCLSSGRLVRELEIVSAQPRGRNSDARSEVWYLPLKHARDDDADGAVETPEEEVFGLLKMSRLVTDEVSPVFVLTLRR